MSFLEVIGPAVTSEKHERVFGEWKMRSESKGLRKFGLGLRYVRGLVQLAVI